MACAVPARANPGLTEPGAARRRADGFAHDRPPGDIPAEIAFLAAQGVPPGLLLKAAARARQVDVTADRALLGAGFPEDTFYRLLARHLGMPYVEMPLRLVLPPHAERWEVEPEQAQLTPNARRLDRILAPRGTSLRLLLDTYQAGQGRGSRAAILSPRCLKALIRRQRAPALLHLASHGLGSWDPSLSAAGGFTAGQQAMGLAGAAFLAGGLWLAPAPTLTGLGAIVWLVVVLGIVLRLAATAQSPASATASQARIPDQALPVYTILVPLLHEERVLPRLVAELEALDYPKSKLDIKLMVEENDHGTIAAIESLDLPAPFECILAPVGRPRTKPRALNIGLAHARGQFLVVYDAEDRPESDQLRAAVSAFTTRPIRTACLQARLAVDNVEDSWLTRLFALEYAGLFDVVMPGLAAMGMPVPLGGTSNHFRVSVLRRVGAWDSHNVTEDIDLGFRLARFGYRVEALDSTTFEEAPTTLAAWLPQRSRWLKGWMVTLMVVTRQPRRVLRELGPTRAAAMLAALLGTLLGCLFGPLLCAAAIADLVWGDLLSPRGPVQAMVSTASSFVLVTGAASAFWPIGLGLKRRGRLDLIPWLATLPAYLLLIGVVSWRAVHEAVTDPTRWNKTEHGVARKRVRGAGR